MENLPDGAGADGLRKALDSNKMSQQMNEILAISGEMINQDHDLDMDYFDDGPKMTRAEFIMAGLDLEPIESMYSQELGQLSVAQRPSAGHRAGESKSQQKNDDYGDFGA